MQKDVFTALNKLAEICLNLCNIIHGTSYFCSVCKCGISDSNTEHYCHYCGAKMDGERISDDED